MKVPPLEASPKYPWRSYSTLRTHDFIELFPGERLKPLRFFVCRSCDRRFKFDPDRRTTRAIAESLSELHDSVASRWLAERCTGQRSPADERDATKVTRARRCS